MRKNYEHAVLTGLNNVLLPMHVNNIVEPESGVRILFNIVDMQL